MPLKPMITFSFWARNDCEMLHEQQCAMCSNLDIAAEVTRVQHKVSFANSGQRLSISLLRASMLYFFGH